MKGVAALAADLRAGHTDAVTLAQTALAAARQTAPGAFVTVTEEIALAAARRADAELARGIDRGPLQGIPVAVKDVVDVEGVVTGNGTNGFGHRLPSHDAACWRELRHRGAVLIGKTALDELAWGMLTPGCTNPLDADRISGGSSGGSAAAVAAGVVPLALGTDTGGSVRTPAALCGATGLRPTHGVLSLEGVSALAPSQDTVGAIATTAADCLLAHELMRGGTGSSCPRSTQLPGIRVLLLRSIWAGRVSDAMEAAVEQLRAELADAGARMDEVEVPLARLGPAASLVVMLAESAEAWQDAVDCDHRPLGPRAAAALRCGRSVHLADYARALAVRRELRSELDRLLADRHCVLLLPTVGVGAPAVGSTTVDVGSHHEPVQSALSRFTALASATGHPAVATPAGLDHDGMPLSVQLVGPRGGEQLVCQVASHVEQGTGASTVAARLAQLRAQTQGRSGLSKRRRAPRLD